MEKILLVILDGVGVKKEEQGNAFNQAYHPNYDYFISNYPHSLLEASGEAVGLPPNQMGNSEVGHTNIGAGRIVYQPMQIITENIKSGKIYSNQKILEVINHTKKNDSKIHIMGLLSDGGIHSHIDHLMGIIDVCNKEKVKDIFLHVFLDGRDTLPNVAYKYIKQLENKISSINKGTICTLHGRYYAMDRDNNWNRIKLSYDAIVNGIESPEEFAEEYRAAYYDNGDKPSHVAKGEYDDIISQLLAD